MSVGMRIRRQIEDATNKRIYFKAKEIAHRLGVQNRKKHGAIWRFKNGILTISWDDYAPNLWIFYDGTEVFAVHLGNTTKYRPDIEGWIDLVAGTYEKHVRPVLETMEHARDRARKLELYTNWGITEEKL